MSETLVIAGDLCLCGKVGAALAGPKAAAVWDGVAPVIQAADFAVVNLECPLTDHPQPIVKSGPHLWGPPEAVSGIRTAGFGAVSLANNHILDAGPAALIETLRVCREAGLECVGAGENHAAATTPLMTRVGNLRLSVLAVCENEFSTTDGPGPGAWPLDVVENALRIKKASEESDFVLVLVHGGVELYPLPRPRLQKTCRFFVEMGADAVVCHHTHVVSGYEFYKGRPILYGLGNLLFDDHAGADEAWLTGCMVKLEVEGHQMLDLEIVPCRQDPSVPNVRLVSGAEREAFFSRTETLNFIVSDPDRLERSWVSSCRERRSDLLSSILCLTRPESWLLGRGLLPTVGYRLRVDRLARLRNMFSCESHADSCERMLRDLQEEKGRGSV